MTRTVEIDALPDGRIDHRGHDRDQSWDGWGWECMVCSTEEVAVDWTIPYDIEGRPIPKGWRDLPDAEVRALCGIPSAVTAP